MIANFNIHLNDGVALSIGANGSTVIVRPMSKDECSNFAYFYMPERYAEATRAAVAAFNEAFEAALHEAELPKAAE